MKKYVFIFVSLVLTLSMLLSIPTSAAWTFDDKYNQAPESFGYSFVFVGDTQTLAMLDADTTRGSTSGAIAPSDWKYDITNHIGKGYMAQMYDWIVANKDEKKIAHVFGLGDITQNRNTPEGVKEWVVAKDAWSRMDGKVSYSMVRGNHDNASLYTQYLNYDAYVNQFDGVYTSGKNTARSTYKLLDVGVDKYLLVSLDFGPDTRVMKWAEDIIKAHPDRRVIITTHGYLMDQSRRTSKEKGDWVSETDNGYSWGEDLWNQIVRKYENVFMVVCGHCTANPVAFRNVKGDAGNTVFEVMFNPQGYDMFNRPSGMVGIMYFAEDGASLTLEYYSTIQDEYCNPGVIKKRITTLVADPSALTTTATETTATPSEETSSPDTTAAGGDNSGVGGGCGAVVFMPALPIAAGTAAIALHKKKKK